MIGTCDHCLEPGRAYPFVVANSKAMNSESSTGGTLAAHALSRRPGYLLIKLGEAVKAGAEETLSKVGVTARQYDLLSSVSADGSVSQRDLGRLHGLDPNVVGDVIDELEARGLLLRVRNEKDRRRHALRLTPTGRQLLRKADRAATAGEKQLLADLSEGEIETLQDLTTRLLSPHWPLRRD